MTSSPTHIVLIGILDDHVDEPILLTSELSLYCRVLSSLQV